jgi:hypothetical protein
MPKRRPVKRKKQSKANIAYMKMRRTPDAVTWEDVQAYNQAMQAPQPPLPPLRERLQTVDMGMRPEQAERVVKDTKTKWQKFKGVFDKSKNLATKGGKTALTSGRRVIHMGQEYTTKLDRQAEQQLADMEKEYWGKERSAPEEDETQYVEYEEPEINEDIEEPSIAAGIEEPNIEGYTRRKHRKLKKVKKRRLKKKVIHKRKRVKRKKIKKRRRR